MDVFLSPPHRPDHPFWAGGQVPMMAPPAQPNQVIYPILTLPENRPRLTREQWAMLEHHFSRDRKPTTAVKRGIAQSMNVPLEKINNWFQNRRAKERQEQKKAQAAARDGRPYPEPPSSATIPVGDQQTLQIRPASQPVGPTHHVSSLTPPQLSTSDSVSSQATITTSEELGCNMQTSMPTSLPGDPAFSANPFDNSLPQPASASLPLTIVPNENLPTTGVYSSPNQTVFTSPEQQIQVTSQSIAASASQSPRELHPLMQHDFSEGIAPANVIASGPGLQHLPFVPNDPTTFPEFTFSNGHRDSVISTAVPFSDFPQFFDGLSLPSTPTFPGGHFDEQYQGVSTQVASSVITTAAEFPCQNPTYLELPFTNDMLNSSSVSLPATLEQQPLEHMMPPPDSAKLFKPRQSSQPTLAARRRKNAPGAIVVNPIGSIGRSGSYTAGMPHPISPRSPHLVAPDQTLRRIKSSNNTAGRIQKPMTPAQRSPLVFAFTHNNHLLDNQTPPPSASIVETPSICNVGYPNGQSMLPSEINFNVSWSAPPTQQTFMLPADGSAFSGAGLLPSTPSPTSQPQNLPS